MSDAQVGLWLMIGTAFVFSAILSFQGFRNTINTINKTSKVMFSVYAILVFVFHMGTLMVSRSETSSFLSFFGVTLKMWVLGSVLTAIFYIVWNGVFWFLMWFSGWLSEKILTK